MLVEDYNMEVKILQSAEQLFSLPLALQTIKLWRRCPCCYVTHNNERRDIRSVKRLLVNISSYSVWHFLRKSHKHVLNIWHKMRWYLTFLPQWDSIMELLHTSHPSVYRPCTPSVILISFVAENNRCVWYIIDVYMIYTSFSISKVDVKIWRSW